MLPETFVKRFGLQPYRRETIQDTGEEPKLRVWWARGGEMEYYAVKDLAEAKRVINKLTMADLANPNVGWNTCGMEELEANGQYHEWYNDNGDSITDILDQEEENDAQTTASH